MTLTPSQRIAYNLFGPWTRQSKALPKLDEALRKAQMTVRGEAYLAHALLMGIATGVVTLLVMLPVLPLAIRALELPNTAYILLFMVPPIAGGIGYLAILSTPASNAKKRGKKIELKLPYAVNYTAAMSSAGIIPQEIFRSLSRQSIYGEVAKEAGWMYKDMQVHGMDILTAMRRAMDRSPSVKFQEFLQGAITTITSGGDLTAYFRQKAVRYQWENRVEQKNFIETMGLMAETYVTAAVAGPLFLIVMVAIIVLMGSGEFSQLQLIVYLLLPVINIGFMMGLKAMIPEV
jgi:archaeal flagellar protein FlaJ